MFKFDNVRYKDILKIDTLKIDKGDVVVVVGQTGGGKSTLLKLLNKTISPSEGRITYNGTPLEEIDSVQHRRNVIYLSQNPFVFKETIRDNLLKGLMFHKKKSPSDETLRDILKMVALDKPLESGTDTLSGGEAQRLALGRVLLLGGEVYLLDEPSSALDDETERILIDTITAYVRDNAKTLVMISHSKAIANKHADQILVMDKGTLREGGKNG